MDASLFAIMQTAYITGWVVAAPIGPVNLEIMRRVMSEGFAAGLFIGAGAVCVDAGYLTLFSAGLGEILKSTAVQQFFFFAGGGLLTYLGIAAMLEARRIAGAHSVTETLAAEGKSTTAPTKRSLPRHFLVGLAMTASNPMTIAFWSALSLQFVGISLGQRLAASTALMAGCFSWVLAITTAVAFARSRLSGRVFAIATLAGGACVAYFGIDFLERAIHADALIARLLHP